MVFEASKPRVVLILDQEEGQSRLLSIDDFGMNEAPLSGLDAMADEVVVRQPDLILVTPGALTLGGDSLVKELNRLGRLQPGYTWRPARGELPN
ncbi:MAG TPA: hypothetical protein VMV93_05880 [Chloroflexota bacterium]|nr:hypothetical protein [Chloroflexota bacterium]